MRNFITNLFIWIVVCCVISFFLGGFIFSSFWGIVFLCAFIFAIITEVFTSQQKKIDELEKRIQQIEEKDGK